MDHRRAGLPRPQPGAASRSVRHAGRGHRPRPLAAHRRAGGGRLALGQCGHPYREPRPAAGRRRTPGRHLSPRGRVRGGAFVRQSAGRLRAHRAHHGPAAGLDPPAVRERAGRRGVERGGLRGGSPGRDRGDCVRHAVFALRPPQGDHGGAVPFLRPELRAARRGRPRVLRIRLGPAQADPLGFLQPACLDAGRPGARWHRAGAPRLDPRQ